MLIRSTNGRIAKKIPKPTTSPASAPTSDSPDAISRTRLAAAPTSRNAASLRSRWAAASRVATPTNTSTGNSSTTTPTRLSIHSSGSSPPPSCATPQPWTVLLPGDSSIAESPA